MFSVTNFEFWQLQHIKKSFKNIGKGYCDWVQMEHHEKLSLK